MNDVKLTRRTLMIGVAGTIAATGLLAACGDDDEDDSPTATTPPAASDPTPTEEPEEEETEEAPEEEEEEETSEPTPTDESEEEEDEEEEAPTEAPSGGDTPAGGTLRVATTGDIIDLHPANLSIAGDRLMAESIFTRLIRFRPGTLDLEPDMCESWEISDDGLTYTFSLREGMTWHHDFGPVTSNDVKAIIEYHKNPDNGSRERAQYALVDSVEAPDDLTVIFNLSSPSAALPTALAWQTGFITSAKALEELGDDLSFNPIGAGPYYLHEWLQGESITLKYHEGYYGDTPHFDTIVLPIIPDDTLALLAMNSGELDVLPVWGLGAYRQILQDDSINLFETDGVWQYWAQLQTDMAPTDNVLVRRALAHATNLEEIAASLNGMVTVNHSVLPPPVIGFTQDITQYEYDLDKARELLAEAGYPDPSQVQIHMRYTAARLYEEMALILQDMWSELGIQIQITVDDQAVWTQRQGEGDWNCYPTGVGRLDPDVYCSDFFHSDGPSNRTRYSNPDLDAIIEEARTEMDPDRRAELYHEIQEVLAQDVPVITTGTWKTIIAARDGIDGIIPHPYTGIFPFQYAREA